MAFLSAQKKPSKNRRAQGDNQRSLEGTSFQQCTSFAGDAFSTVKYGKVNMCSTMFNRCLILSNQIAFCSTFIVKEHGQLTEDGKKLSKKGPPSRSLSKVRLRFCMRCVCAPHDSKLLPHYYPLCIPFLSTRQAWPPPR